MSKFNLNYTYLNPNKYFINKIWSENIINNYEKGLNNLNIDFNKKLNYNFENDNNQFLSGYLQSNDFSEEYFALRPKSENLINLKLQLLSMDIMRDWKVSLEEYLTENYKKLF